MSTGMLEEKKKLVLSSLASKWRSFIAAILHYLFIFGIHNYLIHRSPSVAVLILDED